MNTGRSLSGVSSRSFPGGGGPSSSSKVIVLGSGLGSSVLPMYL